MRVHLWGLPFLLGLAVASPATFPWGSGYLEPGSTAVQPLEFHLQSGQFAPSSQGWSRQPHSVPARVLWSARPLPDVSVVLTPGLPVAQGTAWWVPLSLQLSVTVPAVIDVLNQPVAVHPGLRVLALQIGQEFLRIDLDTVYRHDGEVLDFPELAGRILKLTRLDNAQATFTVDGIGEVQRDGDPKLGFPDLAPLIDDPDLAALKRDYEGKRVWGYGGLHGSCFPSAQSEFGVEVPLTQGVKVERVARLGKPMNLNVQGGPGDEVGGGADALSLTPLVFLLDAAPFASNGGFAFSSGGDTDVATLMAQAPRLVVCGQSLPIYLLDTWAVPRVFSLTPPSDQVPGGTPPSPGIATPVQVRGLTRWQYAWLSGFPSSTFGDLKTLLRLPEWAYRNIPFPTTVTFGKQGKVTEVDVPRLP